MSNATLARSGPSTALALDLAERAAIFTLYAWLVTRLIASMAGGGSVVNGLLLVSEGMVIVFLLARAPTDDVSRNPAAWLLAFAATCGPLLINPGRGEPLVPASWAASVWLAGILIQVAAKFALGRSFGCVAAHRGLKRGGPYRYLRHPMYTGYLLSHVAFWLMNPTLANLAIYALCDLVQVPRILFEERLLGRDPAYRTYCGEVRWRMVPGVF